MNDQENKNDLIAKLREAGAATEMDEMNIEATFTDPTVSVGLGKETESNLVIYSCDEHVLIDPANYEYKIFGNTGDLGNGKRIVIFSPIDFQ